MVTGCVFLCSEILAILLLFCCYKTANTRLPAKVSKAFPSRPTFNVAELQNDINTAMIMPMLTSRHLGSTRGLRVKHFLSSRVNYYTNAITSFQIARLLISEDICPNPGPNPITNCSICTRTIARNHWAISCDLCTLWCHINCGNVNPANINGWNWAMIFIGLVLAAFYLCYLLLLVILSSSTTSP